MINRHLNKLSPPDLRMLVLLPLTNCTPLSQAFPLQDDRWAAPRLPGARPGPAPRPGRHPRHLLPLQHPQELQGDQSVSGNYSLFNSHSTLELLANPRSRALEVSGSAKMGSPFINRLRLRLVYVK